MFLGSMRSAAWFGCDLFDLMHKRGMPDAGA